MAKVGALRPQSYEDIRSVWQSKREDEALSKGADPEDVSFATLANMEGWKNLKAHINSLKMGLDKRLAESVLSSLGDEQIKRDAVFAVLGKELLDSIVNRVEDSALAIREIEDERSGDGSNQ